MALETIPVISGIPEDTTLYHIIIDPVINQAIVPLTNSSGTNLNSFAGPKGGQVMAPAILAYITSL